MRLVRPLIAGAALAAIAASIGAAQVDAAPAKWLLHRGFVGSFAIGVGSGGVDMPWLGYNPDVGIAGFSGTAADVSYDLFLGFALNSRVRVGAQVDLLDHAAATSPSGEPGSAGRAAYYTAAIALYPFRSSSFWAKANLGYGTLDVQSHTTGFTSVPGGVVATGSGGGFAYGLGAGYDWRPRGGALLVTPYASYLVQKPSVGFGDGYPSAIARASLLQVGVGLGYNR